jgi:hypothetical protein
MPLLNSELFCLTQLFECCVLCFESWPYYSTELQECWHCLLQKGQCTGKPCRGQDPSPQLGGKSASEHRHLYGYIGAVLGSSWLRQQPNHPDQQRSKVTRQQPQHTHTLAASMAQHCSAAQDHSSCRRQLLLSESNKVVTSARCIILAQELVGGVALRVMGRCVAWSLGERHR